MDPTLRLTRWIDRINRFVGRAMVWPLLASVLVSAVNALVRKLFGTSSNAWLEMQWHLFAVAFLGCAGYVLLVDEHVRVDVMSRRWPVRVRAVVDAAMLALVALPMTALFITHGWGLFWRAWVSGETYVDAGGLVLWPIYGAMVAGMALLGLQAASELVRRIAFLRGHIDRPTLNEVDLPPASIRLPLSDRDR
jgi:TRAP-type mannitol/chloroaromatic compound transport system permease small subunit